MRVFHFLNAHYGLDDIKRRRLKISQIAELNDPFELLSIDLSDRHLRRLLHETKEEVSNKYGVLCFSRSWENPVQWGHYADRHQGLCLGFDVPDENAAIVSYTAKRLIKEADSFLTDNLRDEETMRKLLTTKYAHWKYEKEVRTFLSFEDKDPETGLYFAEFSDKLKLVQVIVGARSDISRSQLSEALGSEHNGVTVFKARLAFKSFRVVRNRHEALWV